VTAKAEIAPDATLAHMLAPILSFRGVSRASESGMKKLLL
jgi:hypothetical protein